MIRGNVKDGGGKNAEQVPLMCSGGAACLTYEHKTFTNWWDAEGSTLIIFTFTKQFLCFWPAFVQIFVKTWTRIGTLWTLTSPPPTLATRRRGPSSVMRQNTNQSVSVTDSDSSPQPISHYWVLIDWLSIRLEHQTHNECSGEALQLSVLRPCMAHFFFFLININTAHVLPKSQSLIENLSRDGSNSDYGQKIIYLPAWYCTLTLGCYSKGFTAFFGVWVAFYFYFA